MTEMSMDDFARRGEEALEHYGVKGMKWGVRKRSSSSSPSRFSVGQKRAAIAVAATGASVAAAMLISPLGGMAISGLGRAADAIVTSKGEQAASDLFKDSNFATVKTGGPYSLERNRVGVLSPGGR